MRLGVLLWVSAACSSTSSSSSSSSSSPPPKAPAETPGRAERLAIGNLEAYALEDGHIVVPNDGKLLAVGRPPSETAEVLAAAGLPRDTIRLDIQALLVKAGDRVILFDAGIGEGALETAGRLPHSLARAGVEATAVTDIFISHAHSDHVGGLVTKAGTLAYPAATIRMSAPEWAALQANTDEASQDLVDAIAPKVMAFEPGAQVLPVVKAVATPGHTAGHSSYEISGDGEKLFYTGDLVHHWVISVQRPTWSIVVDTDKPAAEALRQQMLAKLAADGSRVFATHFPFPGVGQVVSQEQGFAWKGSAPATR